MGFITNRFLVGFPRRNRGHDPVKVKFSVSDESNKWSKEHYVVKSLIANETYPNFHSDLSDYQIVYFTKSDLNKILPELINGAGEAIKLKVAKDFLIRIDEKKLVDCLIDIFKSRVIHPPKAES